MKRVNPLLVKSLISAGLAGAVGLGGYGIYSVASKSHVKTIEKALGEDSGVTLLSMEEGVDNEKWDEKVNKLETGNETLDRYQKSGNDSEDKKASNRAKLKDICKDLLKLDSADKAQFETAKKWCTKTKQE